LGARPVAALLLAAPPFLSAAPTATPCTACRRALLKEAPVLLCDEATSAVDTVTEAQIFAALRAVTRESAQRQRTCIIIAHRLSTVVDADLIVVLRAGRVAECGTHAALLQQQGEYAQLWAAQRASEY